MWESPIEIIKTDIQTRYEENVMQAVLSCGINVNKEELIKALQYDRQQYKKGYEDAKAEPHWIPCSERLPEKNCRCLTTNEAWGVFEVDWNAWINGQWLYPNEKPIAWMPLPEPYREDSE